MQWYKFASEVKKWFPGIGKKFIKYLVGKVAGKKNKNGTATQVLIETHSAFPYIKFEASEINSQLHAIYFDRHKDIYEPDIECCMEIIVPQATMFVDIGANWGYFVGKAACMKPDLKLLAFEPTSLSFGDLNALKQGFATHASIDVFNVAVGNEPGTAVISQPGFESGLASLISGNQANTNLFPSEKIEIKTLDKFVITPQTLIKIDVEGFELNALKGGKNQISKESPAIIFEHWHMYHEDLDPFLNFFNELGYLLFKPAAHLLNSELKPTDNRLISCEFSLESLKKIECVRRYNLIALYPQSNFFQIMKPYIQGSE